MKAVTLGDDGVEIKELPNPEPANEQVLVKVKSCGLNRSDLLETQGQSFGHTGGDTKIIGGEFAGEVVQLGEGASNLKVGDNVMSAIKERTSKSVVLEKNGITDAIGYIANQTNEYLYTQSILTYTQVCTHYTQVTHGPTHRYTQECKSCATSKTWVRPKGVITIHVDDTWSHIFLPKYD